MPTAGFGVIKEGGKGGILSGGKGAIFWEVSSVAQCSNCCGCPSTSEPCSFCQTDFGTGAGPTWSIPEAYTLTMRNFSLCTGCLDPFDPGSDEYDYKLSWNTSNVVNATHNLIIPPSPGGCYWHKTYADALVVDAWAACDQAGTQARCPNTSVTFYSTSTFSGCPTTFAPNFSTTWAHRVYALSVHIRLRKVSTTQYALSVTGEKAGENTVWLFSACMTGTAGICASAPDVLTATTANDANDLSTCGAKGSTQVGTCNTATSYEWVGGINGEALDIDCTEAA